MPDSPHIESPSALQSRGAGTPPYNNIPSPASLAQSSNAQLAALLAEALKDVENLKRELVATKKRAEDAERRYLALSSVSDSKSAQVETARVIQEYEQRALDAEATRDDADARRRALLDAWQQLDRYLQTVEMRASDARAAFQRYVTEGGGGQLALGSIPLPGGAIFPVSYGSMAPPGRPIYPSSRGHRSNHSQSSFPPVLPPHPTPNGNGSSARVRPRDGSLDRTGGYSDSVPGQPPHKKLKSYSDDRRGRDERTAYSESNIAYLHQRHQPLPPQTIESRDRIYVERRLPQARMIVPPGGEPSEYANHRGRSRSRSRSTSRSSRSSLSVDTELLLATGEGANGTAVGHAEPSSAPQRSSHRRRHHHYHVQAREDPATGHRYEPTLQTVPQQPQRTPGNSPPTQTVTYPNYRTTRAPHASASVPIVTENHVNAAILPPQHVQPIQTHVFAPVVTGAPPKKNKFSASGGSVGNLGSGTGSGDAPPATPPQVFPAQNAQGQRICRQCGMPGRYKEGKCVEKWGPGPMGPGTVCDRCRKKMKRVERRGNLESQQQLSASNSLSHIGAIQQQAQQTQPIPPRNVVQTQSAQSIHRSDTLISSNTTTNTTTTQQSGSTTTHQSYDRADRARGRDRESDRDNRDNRDRADRDESDARSALVAAVSTTHKTAAGVHSQSTHHTYIPRLPVAASPPPSIASINDELPMSNVGRGAGSSSTKASQSRPQSRNAQRAVGAGAGAGAVPPKRSGGNGTGNGNGNARAGSRSTSEGDADADADADAEEAEADADVETELEGSAAGLGNDASTGTQGEEGDPDDEEILEAAGV